MAPPRRPNRNKPRRRTCCDTDPVSSCIEKLCGAECDQAMRQPERGRPPRRHDDLMDDVELEEMDAAMSDEEYAGSQRLPLPPPPSSQRVNSAAKAGRVTKPKQRKPAASSRVAEMPLHVGLEKAKRYFTEALQFGISAGYVTPKDSKGRVFQLSPELGGSMDLKGARLEEGSGAHLCQGHGELRDDDGQVSERRSRRRSSGRGGRKKRRGKGRSRSRSRGRRAKRRHGRRHGSGANSKSNADGEGKEGMPEVEQEQDEMDERSKAQVAETNQERGDEHEETKSTKSSKSHQKSEVTAEERNSKQQQGDEDDDADEDDGYEEEEDKKN